MIKSFGEFINTLLSTFTIIGLVIGLYRSRRFPLVIDRVVVHIDKDKNKKYNVVFRNLKSFPVTIKNIRAFTKRQTRVEMLDDASPVMYPFLDYQFCCINSSDELTVEANGIEKKTIESNLDVVPKNEIVFSINTTHGYQLIKCRNIKLVHLGIAKAIHPRHSEEYNNKISAIIIYIILWVKFFKNTIYNTIEKMHTNK